MMIQEKIYKTELLKKYNKYFSFLQKINEDINYEEVLPKHLIEEFNIDKKEFYKEILKLDNDYNFLRRIEKYNCLLSKLERAKINSIAYKIFYENEKNSTVKSTIKSFRPFSSYAKKTKYELFNNVTGRLIVKEGAKILTLSKKYRGILETRHEKGKIISLDFSSLEPRLCLKISDKETENDLYEEINKSLDLNLDRSVIKTAIISVLYGSHFSSLSEISASKSKILFEFIKEYFNLDKILEISKNTDKFGIRRNYFGRPLWNLEEEKENILINNYIQSSAVDIALTYFSSLIDTLDLKKAVPLFVLHDAIIFDISEDYIEDFNKIASKGYVHEKLGYFPLKTDIFNINHKES